MVWYGMVWCAALWYGVAPLHPEVKVRKGMARWWLLGARLSCNAARGEGRNAAEDAMNSRHVVASFMPCNDVLISQMQTFDCIVPAANVGITVILQSFTSHCEI